MESDDTIARRVTLRELRVLAAAVAFGSVAKAARELGLTQPAASKTVAALERALGAQLIERSARGVEPTAAGRVLLSRAVNIFDELKQAARELDALAHPQGGDLHVGATHALSAGLLPAVLSDMRQRHPAVRHFGVEAETDILLGQLQARAIDIALARAPDRASARDFDFDKLFDDRLCIVVPAGHRLARRRGVTLEETLAEQWILPSPNSVIGRRIAEGFARAGLRPPERALITMSVLVRFELLARAQFVTTLPESALRFATRRPALGVLALDAFPATAIGIVRLKKRASSAPMKRFAECAQDVARLFQPFNMRTTAQDAAPA